MTLLPYGNSQLSTPHVSAVGTYLVLRMILYERPNAHPRRSLSNPNLLFGWQSHVGAHAELSWLLTCSTPINWLERMIQFKEKKSKQVREHDSPECT